MGQSVLELPAVQRYREAMLHYRAVMRAAPTQPLGAFLPAIDAALAGLYKAGSELPELEPDTSDVPDRSPTNEDHGAIQGAIAALLGHYDRYHDIYNPSDPDDRDPVEYLVSLDLLEILEDQDEAHGLLDPARQLSPNDIVWQWRFGFTSHWGSHAAGALKVIHNLLYTEFAAALEDTQPDA